MTPKLIKGAALSVSARIIVNVIGVISTIVLARILSPSDYGVIAMVMSIGYLLEIFADIGIGTYLISKATISKSDYHTAWTTNFILFFSIGFIYLIGSSDIATFYAKPELESLVQLYSINFFLRAMYNVSVIHNDRKLIFRPFFLIQVLPKIVSFFVTISLALVFKNYWALIYGALIYQFSRTVLSYVLHPYIPQFRIKEISSFLNYSQWLLAHNVFRYLNTKSIDIFIGKQGGSSQLGLYNMAYELSVLPVDSAIDPLNRVLIAGFSLKNKNKTELRHLILNSFAILNVFIFPICIGLYFIAPMLVPLALGYKWIAIVPPLQILALGQIFKTLTNSISSIFLSLNSPKILALGGLITFPVYLISCIFLYRQFGINGIAIAFSASSLIMLIFYLWALLREFDFDFIIHFLFNFLAPLICSGLMLLTLQQVSLPFNSQLLNFVTTIVIGAVSYIVALFLYLQFDRKKRHLLFTFIAKAN